MQTNKDRSEDEDRCPACDAEDWCEVQFVFGGARGRMCHTCHHVERRCASGHWLPSTAATRNGRCVTCTPLEDRWTA